MKLLPFVATIFPLVGFVASQDATTYYDGPTGITTQSLALGVHQAALGVAFPTSTTSDEFIIQMSMLRSYGWIGLGTGGMTQSLLIFAWLNGNNIMSSMRYTEWPLLPLAYQGPVLTTLPASYFNATHVTFYLRCQNCTGWNTNAGPVSLDVTSTAGTSFGFGISAKNLPIHPADPNTAFNQHPDRGRYLINIPAARNANYTQFLTVTAKASPPGPPTPPTTQPGTGKCRNAPKPIFPVNTADGWWAETVLSGITSPRALRVDNKGQLLVLQRGLGITGHKLDRDGCVTSTKVILENGDLSHNLDLSPNGKTLYASTIGNVYSWSYDPDSMTVKNKKTLVYNMVNPGHITRTVLNPSKSSDYLLVARGAFGNINYDERDPAVGRAMIRQFDLKTVPPNGYDYVNEGKIFAYGLRNTVGFTEDAAGHIVGVENNYDEGYRLVNGVRTDVHQDNPAEKLNLHGDPKQTKSLWYGYPDCAMVWEPSAFVDKQFNVGDWFVQAPNGTINDDLCNVKAKKPAALMEPHTAPIDIKLGPDDRAYVTLHGSWNRDPPSGNKVITIQGKKGSGGAWSPTAAPTSKNAFEDFLWNTDTRACKAPGCFRPTGLWVDQQGNVYVASDSSGEVFIVRKCEHGDSRCR